MRWMGRFRAVAAVPLALLAGSVAAWSQTVQVDVRSEKAAAYGRLVLTSATPIGASAKVAGGVLIVTFDRKVEIAAERLPVLLPAYVSAARLDPERTSLRVALVQSVRADLKDAAEALYLDLMPASWRGAPPPLPADVAARLAKRLRDRAAAAQPSPQPVRPPPATIGAAVARAAERTRLTLPMPEGISADVEAKEGKVVVALSGHARFNVAVLRAALADASLSASEIAPDRLAFDLPTDVQLRSAMEDGALALDLVSRSAPPPPALPTVVEPPAKLDAPPPKAERRPAEKVAVEVRVLPGAPLRLRLEPRVPAAVFERDGVVRAILAGTRAVKVPNVGRGGLVRALTGEQHDGWSAVELTPQSPGVASVAGDETGWTITVAAEPVDGAEPVRLDRVQDDGGRHVLSARLPQPADPIMLDDPESSDRIAVVPTFGEPHAMLAPQRFVEFSLPRSALGLIVELRSDDVTLKSDLDAVTISSERGLTLSPRPPVAASTRAGPVFDPEVWAQDRKGNVLEIERALLAGAADSARRERSATRLRLAAFYSANGLARETQAVLAVAAADDPRLAVARPYLLMSALAAFRSQEDAAVIRHLSESAVAIDAEAVLLRAGAEARMGRFGAALQGFRQHAPALEKLPEPVQALLLPHAIEAALAGGDTFLAGHLIAMLEQIDAAERDAGLIPFFQGRIAEAAGRQDEALASYAVAARIGAPPVEAEARLSRALLGQSSGRLPLETSRAELETVAMIWRRGPVEGRALARLAVMAASEGRWRDAFLASRRATEIQPDHPVTRALQDDMARRFEAIFIGSDADKLPKVEALAIFDEFRSLIPVGPKGDAIVRRLADRLADLDLMPQAIELLAHQVQHRLKGAPRAEAASQLAAFQLAEGLAQDALGTLKASRFANLAPDVRQGRLHLEARALSELSRTDLALEIVAADQSTAGERLRADILWRAKRWSEASETYERALGSRWQAGDPLEAGERNDVLRAAIGYVLASDRIGTDRLRTKFMPRMSESPDGDLFRLVTIDYLARPDAFQAAARNAVSARQLNGFLEAYRKRFAPTGKTG